MEKACEEGEEETKAVGSQSSGGSAELLLSMLYIVLWCVWWRIDEALLCPCGCKGGRGGGIDHCIHTRYRYHVATILFNLTLNLGAFHPSCFTVKNTDSKSGAATVHIFMGKKQQRSSHYSNFVFCFELKSLKMSCSLFLITIHAIHDCTFFNPT